MTTFSEFANDHGIVAKYSNPRPEVRDGWPCVAFEVILSLPPDTRPAMDPVTFRLGVGHVKWSHKSAARARLTVDEEHALTTKESKPGAVLKDKELEARTAAKLALAQGVKPAVEDVLLCLALDGRPYWDAQEFEEWAEELGLDTDSRKAEATYRECVKNGRKLKRWLGDRLLSELLECEEE